MPAVTERPPVSQGVGPLDANALGNIVSQAQTPEEAYKVFIANVGAGLTDVIAKSLAEVLNKTLTQTAGNRDIEGWEKFVKGCNIKMDWGAPIMIQPAAKGYGDITECFKNALVTTLFHAVTQAVGPAGKGGSVSVGCSWTF